jgi:predicted DNA-binding protein
MKKLKIEPKQTKSVPLAVRLTPEASEKLTKIAKHYKTSKAAIIEQLIEQQSKTLKL